MIHWSNLFEVVLLGMLSREEVLKIAELAKIELKDDEVEKFRKDLSAILDFVGELKKAGGPSTSLEASGKGLEGIEREDKERGLLEEVGQPLIKQAPETRDGFVVVPEVFKSEK